TTIGATLRGVPSARTPNGPYMAPADEAPIRKPSAPGVVGNGSSSADHGQIEDARRDARSGRGAVRTVAWIAAGRGRKRLRPLAIRVEDAPLLGGAADHRRRRRVRAAGGQRSKDAAA